MTIGHFVIIYRDQIDAAINSALFRHDGRGGRGVIPDPPPTRSGHRPVRGRGRAGRRIRPRGPGLHLPDAHRRAPRELPVCPEQGGLSHGSPATSRPILRPQVRRQAR